MNKMQISAGQRLDRVATKSVLSPGLWLIAVTLSAAVPTSIFGPTWAAVLVWSLATISILGTFSVFIYYAIKNPSLLRSEEYSLKSQALAMYGDGTKSPTEIAGLLSSPVISADEFVAGGSK